MDNSGAIDRLSNVVTTIIKGLVDDENAVVVRVCEEQQHMRLRVTVAPEDFGKVVGRGGQNVEALRFLTNAVGYKLKLPTCADAEGETHVCAHIFVEDPDPNKRGKNGGMNLPPWKRR